MTLQLLDANGSATGRTTTTDANGFYRFDNLRPGVYGVAEIQPAGWRDGNDTPGNRGGSGAARSGRSHHRRDLAAGDERHELQLRRTPAPRQPARLRLFRSRIKIACSTRATRRSAGVMIELLDANRADRATWPPPMRNGNYQFNDLEPGEYGVRERQPLGLLPRRRIGWFRRRHC